MNLVSCQQVGHEQELITSICIDPNCKEQPLACQICIREKHSHHIYKTFQEVKRILNKRNYGIENKISYYKCKFEDYLTNFESLLKILEREKKKSEEWESWIVKGEYNYARLANMIVTLKKCENQVFLDLGLRIPKLISLEGELLTSGTKLQEQFKYKEALEYFKIALKIDGSNFHAEISKGVIAHYISYLGICLLKLNKLDKAITSFDRAHVINEVDYSPYYWKGIALRKKKQYKSALIQFEEALRLKGSGKEILTQIGNCFIYGGITLSKQNLSDQAVEKFDQVIQEARYYEDVYFAKGKCLIRNKRLQEALGCLDQLLVLKQLKCPKAYFLGGKILLSQEKYDQAFEYLQNSIEVGIKISQNEANQFRCEGKY